jgi:hypothetical protein
LVRGFAHEKAASEVVKRASVPGPTRRPALTVSQPGDAHEQEANRAARAAMDMQAQAAPAERPQAGSRALSASSRAFFEPRFGHDFSAVRIDVDPESARQLQARAYAAGDRIVFGAGQYRPDTDAGRELLAHELAHVAHQPRPRPDRVLRSESSAPLTIAQFTETMSKRFGVQKVYTGTRETQAKWVGVPPESLPEWRSWSPGASSSFYNVIVDSFDAFAASLGGTPLVSEIVFYWTRYVKDAAGRPAPDTEAVAAFAEGRKGEELFTRLAVFGKALMSTGRKPLPIARSDSDADYPVMLTTDAGPGAPVPPPETVAQSHKRFVLHELGHGLAALDPKLEEDYAIAVGWKGTGDSAALYDNGVPAVQQALASGTAPDESYHITPADWNSPKWKEQPMSAYSVSGGPGEDLAETVMAYVENKELVKARSPRRFEFLENRETLLQRHLIQPQAAEPAPATAPGASPGRP